MLKKTKRFIGINFYLKSVSLREPYATAQFTSDGKFEVLKGSTISSEIVPSCRNNIKKMREKYKDKIKNNKLTENIVFGSPSTAASFIGGSSRNGLVCWHNADGKNIKYLLSKKQSK